MKTSFHYNDPNAPIPKDIRIGCAAIITVGDRILLEKRSDTGEWGLIGGGINIEEDLKTNILREIKEETGLLLANPEFIGIFSHPSRITTYPDTGAHRIIGVIFRFKLSQEPRLTISKESLDLKFFIPEEIRELDVVATHKHILEDYFSAKEFPIIK